MSGDTASGIAISILTHNRCALLRQLLLSLRELKYEPLEILVVDNSSEDDTKKVVCSEFPEIQYIRTERNIGASARNLGIRNAIAEIVVTLDDDILGLNDYDLMIIDQYFKNNERLAAINFKIVDHVEGKICNWPHHCDPEKYQDKEFLTYEITEGAAAFRKRTVEQVGYYNESFFISHEGPDLAFRILDVGYDVIYSGSISVVHKHSDLGRKPWLNYYYDTRNQFWLVACNLPVIYGFVYLMRGLFSMFIYSIRDGFLQPYLKGIVDGMKGFKGAWKSRKRLSKETMGRVRCINKRKPSIKYLIKTRLLKKGVRL